jgi:hypothetical protein
MLKHAIFALGTLAAGLSIFTTTQASAFTAPPQVTIQPIHIPLIVDVRARGGGHYGGSSGHYNGNRNYRYRNYGYRNRCNSWNHSCGNYHHHNNNYYGNPWWGLGGIGLGFGLGYGAGYYGGGYYDNGYYGGGYNGGGYSRHVAWCLNRYRSYNPRTNTWVSYSGDIHQCRSPYRY